MKTKLNLLFLLIALASSAQTNAVHNWTLKSGALFPGDYFTSGAQMVVIKSHGTNCLLKISELSTNDWLYFQNCKAAQRQRQLDAEAAQMRASGRIEFTVKLMKNFPEQVVNRYGWMDCEFRELESALVDSKEDTLGLRVHDKNGDSTVEIFAIKRNPTTGEEAPEIAQIVNLKPGDKVRLFGVGMPDVEHDDMNKLSGIYVSSIEMIESAADAAAVKKMKGGWANPTVLDPDTGLPK